MSSPRFFLAERRGDWAYSWKRLARRVELPLVELRSLAECEEQLPRHPGSLLAVSTDLASGEAIGKCLGRLRETATHSRTVVLLGAADEADAAIYRELGAMVCIASPLELPFLVQLAERWAKGLPPSGLSLRETIWQRIPWPAEPRAAAASER